MNNLTHKKNISVALTDDHILLRDALSNLIEKIPGYEISFLAEHGIEMISYINKGMIPDIMILDLNMPEMDGYQSAAWLKKNQPQIFILVLTMFDSEIPLIRLLQEGVRGFLKKDTHPEELKIALESLVNEGYYYAVKTAGKIANLFQVNKQQLRFLETKSLSSSDIDFLKLACTDLTYKEIAMQLNMSPKTIDGLRDSLFQRFEVKSRVGLAIYAVRNGIVNL